MAKINHIVSIEKRTDKNGKTYWRTLAVLDDGTEVSGYGHGFEDGQEVQVFFDDKWDVAKMQDKSNKGIDNSR